ncbi:MAG: sensor histidine kinase, partial [Flavobacterium sp.]
LNRIQYETVEILQERDQLTQQNRNLVFIFVGILMIGLLLFVIRMQRSRNRELLLKQAQQKANEDIYNLMISQQNTIEESRIREKRRIAQELHDGVLGRLFGARLNLDSLNRVNSEDAAEKRNAYLTELKNIEQDIREISHDLNREKYVLINNFVAILNNLLEEQRSSFEPEVISTIDESIKWEELGNNLKINLYRIIQESLQNINKYANATIVKIVINQATEKLILTVTDDGEGFIVASKKKGIGLQNMVSRTQELDGTFDLRSKKRKGTTIVATFPIKNEGANAIL